MHSDRLAYTHDFSARYRVILQDYQDFLCSSMHPWAKLATEVNLLEQSSCLLFMIRIFRFLNLVQNTMFGIVSDPRYFYADPDPDPGCK